MRLPVVPGGAEGRLFPEGFPAQGDVGSGVAPAGTSQFSALGGGGC